MASPLRMDGELKQEAHCFHCRQRRVFLRIRMVMAKRLFTCGVCFNYRELTSDAEKRISFGARP